MKIIISPAKKMMECDYPEPQALPLYLEKTTLVKNYLQGLTQQELKTLLQANDEITELNFSRYQTMNLQGNLSPALLSYDGIQYKYMAPQVFTQAELDYVQEHLRIISGFYGILRPLDGVTPYRLEFQARLKIGNDPNLYSFWGEDIYRALDDRVILNLASDEYAKAVKPHLKPEDTFVTCVFGELDKGKIREKGVYVKMARGRMVRFMAENAIESLEDIKNFRELGFVYDPELSGEKTYVFLAKDRVK